MKNLLDGLKARVTPKRYIKIIGRSPSVKSRKMSTADRAKSTLAGHRRGGL